MRPSANQLGLPLAVYAERFEASKVVRQVGPNLPEKPKQTVKLEGQVTVARSLAGVERSLRLLRTILIAGGLAVLLVAALLGLGLAAHLLRPLARMRATAQRIGDERDFSHRMPVDGDPHDELGRLSLSFNQMLAELEQANLGLKTTLDSQRRFVADASHELRTPLTAIRTNVEFLARVPGARTEDRVEALRDGLSSCAGWSRWSATCWPWPGWRRRWPPRPGGPSGSTTSWPTCTATPCGSPRPRSRSPSARCPRPGSPATATTCAGRSGTWSTTPSSTPGRARSTCACRPRAGWPSSTVRDTGIGIAEGHLDHVFDRFWRAPGVRGMAGSGLGLAITRWVVQTHEGTIAVESVVGQGTTFALTLPVVQRPPERSRRREGELLGVSRATGSGHHS